MTNQTLPPKDWDSLLNDNPMIFIEFWAPWCAPCKQFSKVYEQVSEHFPSILFLKINIESQKEWVDFLGIRSIPHLMAIKEGIVVYSDAGNISEKTLLELAKQMQQVDVSEMSSQQI